jgi:hypothetical protein
MFPRGEQHRSAGAASALFEALDTNDVSAVRELLAQGADPGAIDPRSPALMAWPALSYAASGGKSEIVELLLERGAAVDARDPAGGTALIWACNAGHLDCARLLLQAGADSGLFTDEGYTAHGRIPGGNPELLCLLREYDAPVEAAVADVLLQTVSPEVREDGSAAVTACFELAEPGGRAELERFLREWLRTPNPWLPFDVAEDLEPEPQLADAEDGCVRITFEARPGSSRWKYVVAQFVADALAATTANFKGYLDMGTGKLAPRFR